MVLLQHSSFLGEMVGGGVGYFWVWSDNMGHVLIR